MVSGVALFPRRRAIVTSQLLSSAAREAWARASSLADRLKRAPGWMRRKSLVGRKATRDSISRKASPWERQVGLDKVVTRIAWTNSGSGEMTGVEETTRDSATPVRDRTCSCQWSTGDPCTESACANWEVWQGEEGPPHESTKTIALSGDSLASPGGAMLGLLGSQTCWRRPHSSAERRMPFGSSHHACNH